jgi:hypothetical protein
VCRRDFAAHSALRKRHKIALPSAEAARRMLLFCPIAGGVLGSASLLHSTVACWRLAAMNDRMIRCDLCPECGHRGRRCG